MKLFVTFFLILLPSFGYEVYIDPTKSLTLNDMMAPDRNFTLQKDLSFGIIDATVWIKMELENQSSSEEPNSILLINGCLGHVNFFESKDGAVYRQASGAMVPPQQRSGHFRHHTYQTTLLPHQKSILYISFSSKASQTIQLLHFRDLHNFYGYLRFSDAVIVALLTVLAAFFLYNLFIYLITKERVALYYVGYLFTLLVFQLMYTGSMNVFYLGHFYYHLFQLSISGMMLFLLLFFHEILRVKTLHPLVDRLFKVTTLIFMLFFIFYLFDDSHLLVTRNLLIIVTMLFLSCTLIYALYKRRPFTLLLTLGWSVFLVSIVYITLYHMFELPYNTHIEYILLLGSTVEVIIFSTIFGSRLRFYKKDIQLKNEILQLKSKEAQMGEMLGMIAHQWRQPLTAINAGALDCLIKMELDNFDTKHYKAFLQSTMENIDFLSETINDFRSFFRNDRSLQLTTIDKPLAKALTISGAALMSNAISVDKHLYAKGYIEVNANELTQVILNIIKNAEDNFLEKQIKHPKIIITTTERGRYLELLICDNGGGIPDDDLKRIFTQGFSTKVDSVGTGLGLYMAKQIIENKHQGTLDVYNDDQGVCFKILLPLKKTKTV